MSVCLTGSIPSDTRGSRGPGGPGAARAPQRRLGRASSRFPQRRAAGRLQPRPLSGGVNGMVSVGEF